MNAPQAAVNRGAEDPASAHPSPLCTHHLLANPAPSSRSWSTTFPISFYSSYPLSSPCCPMKCAVRDNFAALLLFSSILPSHAYPGGHQPRGSPTTTSLSHSLSSSTGLVRMSLPPDSSVVAEQYIASGPATTVVFPIASSSSTHLVMAPSGAPEALTQRHEPHLPLQSSLLNLLDGQDKEEYEDEECDDGEVNDTFDDELRHLAHSSRGEHHIGSLCEDTISAVFDQLEDIRAALQGHRAVLAQDKRQVVDVLDKEQGKLRQRMQCNAALTHSHTSIWQTG